MVWIAYPAPKGAEEMKLAAFILVLFVLLNLAPANAGPVSCKGEWNVRHPESTRTESGYCWPEGRTFHLASGAEYHYFRRIQHAFPRVGTLLFAITLKVSPSSEPLPLKVYYKNSRDGQAWHAMTILAITQPEGIFREFAFAPVYEGGGEFHIIIRALQPVRVKIGVLQFLAPKS